MANEKRLIDANACYWRADEKHAVFYQERAGMYHLRNLLEDCPTVDAVEVVRCKDCAFFARNTKVDRDRGSCMKYGFGCMRTKKLDDFCSYGERKDNGTTQV